MADKFEVGDLVQLKSGGAQMTVTIVRDGFVLVNWADDRGTLQSLQAEAVCFVLCAKENSEGAAA